MRPQNTTCQPLLAHTTPTAYNPPMDAPTPLPPTATELSPSEVDALLAELAGQGGDPKNRDRHRPAVGARPPATLRYSHDAMIDAILSNPRIRQGELAQIFGYTPSWVSTIMSSDAFKARLAMRRELLVDPTVRDAIEDRLMGSAEKAQALLDRSLAVLQEKLEGPASAIPDNLALRAAEFGAKTLGLGGNAPPAPPAPSANRLEELADRLIALQNRAVRGADVSDAKIIRES